jgi:hypothetical protein
MPVVTQETPFVAADDTFHALSDDPFETETNWWAFNAPDRKLGCWVHAAVKPNQGVVTWRVFVWDDQGADPMRLAYYRKGEDLPFPPGQDLRDIAFPQGGYRLRMLSPLMEYAVGYDDPDRRFALDFTFKAYHPPRRATPGEPPAMFNPHLDQLGRLSGTMVLNGERIALDGLAVRDRTWGPRGGAHMSSQKAAYQGGAAHVLEPGGPKWREVERERGRGRIQYIFGHTDERNGFLSFVRPQDGDAEGWSPMNNGWLLRDGVFANIDKTKSRMKNFRDPMTGWSDHMLVEAFDFAGRRMTAEGFAVSHMCEHGGGSNALFRWELDGKIGWGEDQDGWRPEHFRRMLDALRASR